MAACRSRRGHPSEWPAASVRLGSGTQELDESFERFSEFLVDITEPKAFVVGDMARVVGVERFRGTMAGNGNKVEFLAATTNLWERHGAKWLLTLHHSSHMVA